MPTVVFPVYFYEQTKEVCVLPFFSTNQRVLLSKIVFDRQNFADKSRFATLLSEFTTLVSLCQIAVETSDYYENKVRGLKPNTDKSRLSVVAILL